MFGSATGGSGGYAAVWGQVPSTGSSAATGVKGENLNPSGGIGVFAWDPETQAGACLHFMLPKGDAAMAGANGFQTPHRVTRK